MNRVARIRREAPVVFLFTVVLALGPAPAQAQKSPPLVKASFELQSPEFLANFGSGSMERVRDSIAIVLTRQLAHYFRFLRWVSASEREKADHATAQITFSMVSRPGGFAPTMELIPSLTIDSAEIDVPNTPVISLYGPFDRQPTQNPDQLIVDIRDSLTAVFRSDNFKPLLHKRLLSRIPLVDSIGVLAEDKQIAIPLRWDDLNASGESVFEVTFLAQDATGTRKEGNMQLELQGRLLEPGSNHRAVRCNVTKFEFPPHDEEKWLDEIATVIGRAVGGSVKVFMFTYYLEANTHAEGALLTRLSDGVDQ